MPPVHASDPTARTTRDDLETEIVAVLIDSIAAGHRHSSHKLLTGELPKIWIEAVRDRYGWRVTAWETGLVAVARFATSEAPTEVDAMQGALAAWRDGLIITARDTESTALRREIINLRAVIADSPRPPYTIADPHEGPAECSLCGCEPGQRHVWLSHYAEAVANGTG